MSTTEIEMVPIRPKKDPQAIVTDQDACQVANSKTESVKEIKLGLSVSWRGIAHLTEGTWSSLVKLSLNTSLHKDGLKQKAWKWLSRIEMPCISQLDLGVNSMNGVGMRHLSKSYLPTLGYLSIGCCEAESLGLSPLNSLHSRIQGLHLRRILRIKTISESIRTSYTLYFFHSYLQRPGYPQVRQSIQCRYHLSFMFTSLLYLQYDLSIILYSASCEIDQFQCFRVKAIMKSKHPKPLISIHHYERVLLDKDL